MELAAIGADGDVAQATLAGLGLRDALLGEAPNAEPTDRLIAAIREREALLILDNCEHVIESAAAFAHRVLGECRRLRILATSREPLGITGEALWLVEPLALPDGDAEPGEIESSPAVRLLRDRAGAVRKDLAVDAHTLSTMARVCRALDGMPLAIELAAARLRTMSLDQLANRLDDRFRLLTGGSRTALPRHRTLRAVVDWSWELLTDAERMVLRRLSVFSGGASLEAAERVCVGDAVEPRAGARVAHRAGREVAAGRRGRRRAALPDARHDQGVRRGTGSPRRESRTWPARRISPTSPSSPRPRSRICAAPSSWNGSPRSRPSTTTSVPRCVARSRPARRRRRCGSRRPPAGTGGSAGTRPRASS